MAVSVTRLMQTQGKDISFARVSTDPSTFDPATGSYTQVAPTTATLRGVMVNYADDEIDETRILSQDCKLLLDATSGSFTPLVGDRVEGTVLGNEIDGGFTIKRVREISPNGTPTAYVCQVRG